MPKKKQKTRRNIAKKRVWVGKVKNKKRIKPAEEIQVLFDSAKGDVGNIFSAGFGEEKQEEQTVITFADFKSENIGNLEDFLKEFGLKFCKQGPSVIPEPPKKHLPKNQNKFRWLKNLFFYVF